MWGYGAARTPGVFGFPGLVLALTELLTGMALTPVFMTFGRKILCGSHDGCFHGWSSCSKSGLLLQFHSCFLLAVCRWLMSVLVHESWLYSSITNTVLWPQRKLSLARWGIMGHLGLTVLFSLPLCVTISKSRLWLMELHERGTPIA